MGSNDTPKLLAGGNPQIPKGDGPGPVSADVGDQLDARFAMNQRTTGIFLRQRVKIARVGGGKAVANVARAVLKQGLLF